MVNRLIALFFLLMIFFDSKAILTKPALYSPADNAKNVSTCVPIQATSSYGNAQYQFEYATNSQFTNAVRVWSYDGGNVGFGYTLPLSFNTQYFWRARIFSASDSSLWTDSRTFTTDTAIHLLGPSNNIGPTSPGIYFSLARNTHYNAYLLECDTVSNFSSSAICRQFIADTFSWFYIETREPCIGFNQRYYWRLKGFKNTDTSAWTAVRTFITGDTVRIFNPAPILNNAPTTVKFEYGLDRFLSHQLQYDTLADFSSPDNIRIIPKDFQDYIFLQTLHFDKTYYWRIRACATTDTSKWTTPRQIRTTGFKGQSVITSAYNPIRPVNAFSFGLLDSATAYQVQGDFTPSFDSPLLIDSMRYIDRKKTPGYSTSVTFMDIPFNKTMYVRARPMHAADTGEWSNTLVRNTISQATTYYPFNNYTNVPVDTLFQFPGYTGIDQYRVQRDIVPTFNSPALIDTSYIQGTTSHMPKMNYDTRYYWRLMYIRKSDSSYWSPTATFTTQIKPILRSPLQFHLSGPGVEALLDWDSMPGTELFEVMVDTSKDFNSPALQILLQDGKKSYLELKHLYFGKYYYWKVRAMHARDTSIWSETWFFTTYEKPNLDWPKNNQTGISFGSLDWSSIKGTEGYECYMSTDSLFSNSWYAKESKTNSFFHYFTPNPTQFNTRYFWKVRVFHAKDTSQWSDVWSFTTRPRSGVTLTFPANAQQKIPPGTTLSWEAISNATQYVVALSETSDLMTTVYSTATTNQIAVSLKVNQTYFWKVIAKNKDGVHVSDTSVMYSFTTDSAFASPNLLSPADKLTKVPVNSVGFSWSSVAGANYDIQFSLDPGFVSQQTQTTGQNSLVVSAFQYNRTYYWRVRAKNQWSTGPWSSSRSFTTIFGLSTPEMENTAAFFVYPNPAKDVMHFNAENLKGWRYTIYSLTGQEIHSGSCDQGYLDVKPLASGFYRLSLKAEGTSRNIKIQVIKD